MTLDGSFTEVLKAFFPLLDGEDLTSCMLVSRQWRDVARDEYYWKRICSNRWPSICKRPLPVLSYRELYRSFSQRPPSKRLPPPRLSFRNLEFYIDVWSAQQLVFSEAISGLNLQKRPKNLPEEVSDVLKNHLANHDYKMMVRAEPSFSVPHFRNVTVSVLIARSDTNKVACVLDGAVFDYIDRNAFRAIAYDYLTFSPAHPFVTGIRAWVSLLFLSADNDNAVDVFAVEIDFCDAASSEDEVLWLLDMLDWK